MDRDIEQSPNRLTALSTGLLVIIESPNRIDQRLDRTRGNRALAGILGLRKRTANVGQHPARVASNIGVLERQRRHANLDRARPHRAQDSTLTRLEPSVGAAYRVKELEPKILQSDDTA